jgi:hypothetical protein
VLSLPTFFGMRMKLICFSVFLVCFSDFLISVCFLFTRHYNKLSSTLPVHDVLHRGMMS